MYDFCAELVVLILVDKMFKKSSLHKSYYFLHKLVVAERSEFAVDIFDSLLAQDGNVQQRFVVRNGLSRFDNFD
jgi:hypothetical protein